MKKKSGETTKFFSTVIQEEEEAERKTNLLIERLRCREKQRFVVFKLGTGHRSSTSRQPLLCLLKESSLRVRLPLCKVKIFCTKRSLVVVEILTSSTTVAVTKKMIKVEKLLKL